MICHRLIRYLGPCPVNLFATKLNTQLPQYISWHLVPFSMAVDALSCRAMLSLPSPRYRQKEQQTILLVVPVWPTQGWYLLLLELLVDLPILLPMHEDLLRDPFDRPHPLLEQKTLQHTTWKVSGRSSWHKVFLERWPRDGRSGWAGAIGGKWIPFRVA